MTHPGVLLTAAQDDCDLSEAYSPLYFCCSVSAVDGRQYQNEDPFA